jgi:hypothetical protein
VTITEYGLDSSPPMMHYRRDGGIGATMLTMLCEYTVTVQFFKVRIRMDSANDGYENYAT